MKITSVEIRDFLLNVVNIMEENKELLCELDRKLGDGDHGITMSIGWQAVKEKLESDLKDENDCSKICIVTARTFLSAVGSSVGPLYATGFMRGGKVFQGKLELGDSELKDFWVAFVNGVKERGNAKIGDKTMIDALEPAIECLQTNFNQTNKFLPSFELAVEAAKNGMESTKNLLSKRGRSSRLGERSRGTKDPGAMSAYLILNAFLQTVSSDRPV